MEELNIKTFVDLLERYNRCVMYESSACVNCDDCPFNGYDECYKEMWMSLYRNAVDLVDKYALLTRPIPARIDAFVAMQTDADEIGSVKITADKYSADIDSEKISNKGVRQGDNEVRRFTDILCCD